MNGTVLSQVHIHAELSDGTTAEVSATLDPDMYSFACLAGMIRELVIETRGSLPQDVQVARVFFDPAY